MTDVSSHSTVAPVAPVAITPWPSERWWLRLMLVLSVPLWTVLYLYFNIGVLALFLVWWSMSRVFLFLAHLRGSAVRIGPDQLPKLFERVQELSRTVGLKQTPDVYVMQQGGVLNAFAWQVYRRTFVILNSDLLEACGDNEDARDFIIGHELGHHAAKHLQVQGLIAPVRLVPFLWKAYSRAREYTCDRYGMAVVKDRQAALRGLAILAAGRSLGSTLDLEAFVRQRAELNRAAAKLGTWLSTHPPLCDRIAALDPALEAVAVAATRESTPKVRAPLGAVAVACLAFAVPYLLIVGGGNPQPYLRSQFQRLGFWSYTTAQRFHEAPLTEAKQAELAAALASAKAEGVRNVSALIVAVEHFAKTKGRLPYDGEMPSAWKMSFGETPYPEDPEWEAPYGYSTNGRAYLLSASCSGCTYLSEDGGQWGDWHLKLRELPADAAVRGGGAIDP